MTRSYVCLPYEYLDDMEELSNEEFGRLVRGLLRYSQTGETIDAVGNERFYIKQVMRTEDRFRTCFEEKAERRSASGRKAAEARWSKHTDESDRMRTHTNASNRNAINAPIVLGLDIESIDIDKNKEDNTNSLKEKENQKEKESRFDRFWSAYPRKVGKGEARKAFSKVKGVPVETMIRAIEQQKVSQQWVRDNGQYIPYPATWLNQERWEDEVATTAPAPVAPDFGDLDALYEELNGLNGA